MSLRGAQQSSPRRYTARGEPFRRGEVRKAPVRQSFQQRPTPSSRIRCLRVTRIELLLGVLVALVVILIGPWFVKNFTEFVLPSRHNGSIEGMTTTYLFKIASLLLLVGCSFWHVSDVVRNRQKALEERERVERELRG